jgi:hypothetical protein
VKIEVGKLVKTRIRFRPQAAAKVKTLQYERVYWILWRKIVPILRMRIVPRIIDQIKD